MQKQHLKLLHKILSDAHAINHKTRLKSLLAAVESVTEGSSLSVTSIGRHMKTMIKPRSKISAADYLLANGHLLNERLRIYAAINRWIIGDKKKLFIVIDWSCLVPFKEYLLRASLLCKGRCVTVYDDIFPVNQLGAGKAHQHFLETLKLVLPRNCEICLIVDAGFKTDFFLQVETTNWNYIARVLSNMHYTPQEKRQWEACNCLYQKATSEPQAIGAVTLTKSNKVNTHLYLYKKLTLAAEKDQTIRIRKIKHGKKEKEYKKAAKRPWLIASSIAISAKEVMEIYKKRMKIEHDFRDFKDPKWGLGIRESRSNDPERLRIQLLIGYLAAFILWLIGLCLEKKKLHFDFQANSVKHKRVLSLIFLALEGIRNGYMKFISLTELRDIRKNGLLDEIHAAQIL